MFNVLMKSVVSCPCQHVRWKSDIHGLSSNTVDIPDFDYNYLCDPKNTEEIKQNILKRKGIGDIDKVRKLYKDWLSCDVSDKENVRQDLIESAKKIPNNSHISIASLSEEPLVVKTIGDKFMPNYNVKTFDNIGKKLNLCKTDSLSNLMGHRSYYFLDQLSELEQALIKYTLSRLKKFKFKLISVPDILPRSIIEDCGMDTRGERNQVYSLDQRHGGDYCLSGTAEMGIAYYLRRKLIKEEQMPLRIAAVSRCFRAETSKIAEEKGIYRVHQFTKVEMFGVSSPDQSEALVQEFVEIQEEGFSSLGLTLRTLDMPPPELGAQASRKFDVEAWLPGRGMWGEVSSTSNCTDYQSRRLGIKIEGKGKGYAHTVNGTASAIPRLIIALLETHQKQDGTVELPQPLAPFMKSRVLEMSRAPKLSVFKTRERFS